MTRVISTLSATFLALAAALALAAPAQAQSEGDTDTAPAVIDHVLGDPDAPVELIEYASFTCPHCKNFHLGPLKDIKANYIDTGKVKLIYREVYFDKFGLWAAMVARCGGEMRYFGIADMLYEQQRDWLDATDASGIADNLRRIGRAAGLSDADLDVCLTDSDTALALVTHYQENATRDGIEATPSFVIGGTTYKNMSYDDMAALLDAEIAKAE